jgi:hypothetical protein
MNKFMAGAGIGIVCLTLAAGAQIVTFNQPSPWMSFRTSEIGGKVLLDTAKLAGKTVEFSLYKVTNGGKKKLGSYTAKTREYSQEFTLAKLGDRMLGGRDYLKIEWVAKGNGGKGSIEPFGIAIVDNNKIDTVVRAKYISGSIDVAAAKSALAEEDFITVGGTVFSVLWNEKVCGIVCKKVSGTEDITLCFDGKNGKNSFLSYSDRFVSYSAASDSARGWHYTRSVTDSGIGYKEELWINGITKQSDPQIVVIIVPWHDTGMIPFSGRMIGFAAFAGESTKAPAKANREIPGTWGDLVLQGGPAEKKTE